LLYTCQIDLRMLQNIYCIFPSLLLTIVFDMKIRMIWFSVTIAIIVFKTSCTSKEKEIDPELVKFRSNVNYELQIADTIDIPFDGKLFIADYNSVTNDLLSYDYYTNKIVIYNIESNEISIIDKFGQGKHEYGKVLGLNFCSDSSFVLASQNGVIFYKNNGEFINIIPYEFNEIRRYTSNIDREIITEINGADTSFFIPLSEMNGATYGTPDYFEKTTSMMKYSGSSRSYHHFAPYEEGSVFRNGVDFYSQFENMFKVVGDELLLLRKGERRIYIYNKNNGDFKNSIELDPDNWVSVDRCSFETMSDYVENEDPEQIDDANYYNHSTFYLGLFAFQDTILTVFRSPFSDNFDQSDMYKSNSIPERERKKFASLYIDGIKQGVDIQLHENCFDIQVCKSLDKVFMSHSNREKSISGGQSVVYLGSIVPID
jgi:hypothetical protein